jgi:3-hydroxyacyl-CoA dehydrogenase/enoyl-CoA hydratase/3-hydroxybutyryl-CoA epimerase
MHRLRELVRTVRGSTHIRALVVMSGHPDTFIVGADVNEIAGVTDPAVGRQAAELGQSIFGEIADLPIPVVAAIDGTCLGGGAELALACHYRIASDSPKVRIGLPEVRLGILPGFGGTQRLPRLVGLPRALDMILSSKNLDGRRAKRAGLVDVVVPQVIFDNEIVPFAERAATGAAPAYRVPPFKGAKKAQARRAKLTPRDRFLESRVGLPVLFRETRKKVLATTKGHYQAPLVAMDVMREGWGKPLYEGLELEAAGLGRLVAGDEKKALVHVFFLTEANRRDTGVDAPVTTLPIRRAGLAGAGVMGGGIAQLLSRRNIPVRMKDLNDEALLSGLQSASKVYRSQVRRRRLRPSDADRYMSLIHPTLDYSGFRRVDIVFEAVVEKMLVKKQVLAEVETVIEPDTIFASNTSALSVTELARDARRPDNVAGFHFFNPVHRMPLIEVVRGQATSDRTVATLMTLARRLGKTPILCQDGPGFLVNRVLGRYLNEANHLLADGVTIEHCDRVATDFGMPMGPIRLVDEVGVDVAAKVANILLDELGDRYQTNNLLERLQGEQRLGRKVNRGFYRYVAKGPKAKVTEVLDPSVPALIETGGRRFEGSDREILDRLILVMVDEAARSLDDGIVRTPGDVDIGMIFGTGFPPFRGGLLRYADAIGIRLVTDALMRLSETVSPRFAPCETLKEMAARSLTFYR